MTTSAVAPVSNSNLLTNYINSQNATAAASTSSTTSGTAAASESSALNLDFSQYLKILTTQLQNQDPTNATDPNSFTQELVQLGSVQAGITTNQDLTQLINLQTGSSISSSLGYIGNYVEASTSSNQMELQNNNAEIGYTLGSAASNVQIQVLDSNNNVVATLSGTGVTGQNYATWNGVSSTGTTEPAGTYTFNVTATDTEGTAVTVSSPQTIAQVTAIQTNTDGTLSLICGGLTVSSTNVGSVFGGSLLPSPNISSTTTTTPTT